MDKKNTPEVKLGQYKGLAVTRHVRPVTDKTVDIELVHQTRMHAVYHPTTEPAKRGFRALLDFAGYMDGKEIPDSRMEKVMVVLGDGKLMPAAEQAIYGHRAGEVFRFDFTYPQDFRLPELSGKTAQFEIELRSLAEKVTPAPDEAFAKSLGFDSLDALKADLRAKKQKIHEEGADRAAGKQLLDMAGANMTVDLPAEILDRTAQNEMKLLKERLSRSGITLEQHCKNSRTTPEALEKDYRAQAESRIRFVSISLDKNPKRAGGQQRVPPPVPAAGHPRGGDPESPARGYHRRRAGRKEGAALPAGQRTGHYRDRCPRKGVIPLWVCLPVMQWTP